MGWYKSSYSTDDGPACVEVVTWADVGRFVSEG
ncbi:DUF397 domain-containing protein [Streptomyces sp. NBC_01210]|nr:DUF397 domain-containing protein [Streptomyces sp. NBC_01210]